MGLKGWVENCKLERILKTHGRGSLTIEVELYIVSCWLYIFDIIATTLPWELKDIILWQLCL